MIKAKQKPVSANYLDYIPVPAAKLNYEVIDGNVTIFQENTGVFNWIAQKVWKKPRVSQIHLDEMGNFIWSHLDGEKDIMTIAGLIKEKYGEAAEPLYNRVVQYFKTLVDYGFVEFVNR